MSIELYEQFTMAGFYKRRTFMEWIIRKPRELQQFMVVGKHSFGIEYEPN